MHDISAGHSVSEDILLILCQLPDGADGTLHSIVRNQLKLFRNDPMAAHLTLEDSSSKEISLEQLFAKEDLWENTPKVAS